jgi:diguanylate cyclase (GGDEF)-like protein/putative nucleotidyltransferase with HDIG domain
MPCAGRAYILAISAAGAVVAWHSVAHHTGDWHPLWSLLLLIGSLLASGLKVSLPGITGTMSVNFLFILLSVVYLSPVEALGIGALSFLLQYLWRSKGRWDWAKVAFNLSSVSLAVTTTWGLFHSIWLREAAVYLPARLAIAAAWYFVANTFTVAVVVALTERKPLRKVWQECYFWTFPYYLAGAALIAFGNYLASLAGWPSLILLAPAVYLIHRSYKLYVGRLESEKRHAEEMAALHLRTIEALALAIDAKDQTTHDHLRRVQIYALEVGKELGLSAPELEALRASALLHDIGKLAVPEHIISKPGRLTPEEFEKMKIHPSVGAEILERVQFPYPVVPIVRAHHERWDGAGYPAGLRGEEIPIGARILAAVDCLDALASDRQYRRALPLEEALRVVVSESGRAFDPRVVEVLERRCVELEALARCASLERSELSWNRRIERGTAPAAGFERAAEPPPGRPPLEFLDSIAAARQEVQILFEMTQNLGNSLSLDETLSVLALRLGKVIPYDALAIYLLEGGRLRPEFVTGDEFRLFSSLEIPAGEGLSGWVAENRKPIINGNPSVEPGYLNDPLKTSALRSALSVPLEAVGGVVGVLTLYHARREAFTRDHLRILQAISSKLALSIENSLKYRHVRDSATTDFLTGLPNARSLFLHLEQEVTRSIQHGTPLTVLACDLDGFKQVNDRFGHLEGNRVLRAVASELRALCRDYDYVARMGGDEFVIVMPGVHSRFVDTMVTRFREAVERVGREVSGGEPILSVSMGRAVLPEDGLEAERLLAKADMEMYKVKHAGKLHVSEQIARRALASLEEELRGLPLQ